MVKLLTRSPLKNDHSLIGSMTTGRRARGVAFCLLNSSVQGMFVVYLKHITGKITILKNIPKYR